MKYYKMIIDGIITMIGSGSSVHETQTEITKEEYDSLMEVIKDRPVDTFDAIYELREHGEYVGRERTYDEKVDWYIQSVLAGTITIDAVPAEYREKVKAKMPVTEEEQMVKEILIEVSEYGY